MGAREMCVFKQIWKCVCVFLFMRSFELVCMREFVVCKPVFVSSCATVQ